MTNIYDIATENGFRVITAYAKKTKHEGEYSYLKVASHTWPHLVITYERTTVITSERGERRYSLFDSKPEIVSESMNAKNIPVEWISQAAKAFTDAEKLMLDLKKFNPVLPPWREHEEPGDY